MGDQIGVRPASALESKHITGIPAPPTFKSLTEMKSILLRAAFFTILFLMGPLGDHAALAQSNREGPLALSPTLVYKLTREKTVWIVSQSGDGTSVGTGVLIDAENRYILTAAHVVDGARAIHCFFPDESAGENAEVPAYYLRNANRLAIQGRVVASKRSKDLALVQLRPRSDQVAAGLIPRLPIALASRDLEIGQNLNTLGSSGVDEGVLWRRTGGSVRHIYRRRISYEGQEVEARIIESDMPFNPGDSGGPLVSDYGVLVGINSGQMKNDKKALIRFDINQDEIYEFLNEAPFPVCISRLMSLRQEGGYLRYIYSIYGNDLQPHWQHQLVTDQEGIRIQSSNLVPIR